MINTIITSVVGALSVVGFLAALKSRWLYVVVPKLYLNTPISDGQILILDIKNAGLMSEEDVALTFRQACKFELIATSKSTLSVSGSTLSVPKLSRLETVSVVLLIEEKSFDVSDIESIESKAAKGKIVDDKDKATALWQTLVVIPVLFVFLVLPFVFGTYIGSETRVSAVEYMSDKMEIFGSSKQLANFDASIREVYSNGSFEGVVQDGLIGIEVDEIVRRGDVITINTTISNETEETIMVDGYLKSSSGERGPLSFRDDRVESFALNPGDEKVVTQRAFLPESLSAKVIKNRFTFESMSEDSVTAYHLIEFD